MRSFVLSALWLAACSAEGPTDDDTDGLVPGSDLEAALVAVFGSVPDEGDVLVWAADDPLPAGTTLAPAYVPEGEPDPTVTLADERRFFFVDEAPFTLYEHDVSYVLLDPATQDAEVVEASWYPLVDDDLYEAELVYGDPEVPDFDEVEAASLAPAPPQDPDPILELTPRGKINCKDRKNGAVLLTGLVWPDVVQGDIETERNLVPWGEAGVATLKTRLEARGYEVVTVPVATLRAATSTRTAMLDAVTHHLASKAWDRFFVYYVGHGGRDGQLLPHAPRRGRLERISAADLSRAVSAQDVLEVDVAIDACYSGKLAAEVPGLPEADRPLDLDLHVLAAATAEQTARIVPQGALLGMSLDRWAGRRAADAPLDLRAYTVRELAIGRGAARRSHNPTRGDAPSKIPLLEERLEGSRCMIAGEIDFQAYDRVITIRGLRFGETRGNVLLDNGCLDWVAAEVTNWTDKAVAFHAPMGSDGFPASIEGAYQNAVDGGGLPCEGDAIAPPGAYRVRIQRADGFANHGTGPTSPPVRPWTADDRVQLSPQLYCQAGARLPSSAFPDGLEYSEFYVPMTPPSNWTNGATLIRNEVRSADDLFVLDPVDDECDFLVPGWTDFDWNTRDESPNLDPGGNWEPVATGWFTQPCHEGGLAPPGTVDYWGSCLYTDPPAESGQLGSFTWYE